MKPSDADWAALQGAIAGDVILPGSPRYELARKPANARFHDIWPQAVVQCKSPADAAETISLARRHGVPTAIRSGGHCFAGRSSTSGVVIDVTPMSAVSVSGAVAAVGAGARLGAMYDTLAQQDVTIPAGCGATVGIAGLTLGGGFGILGRRYGLTCDQLLTAQVVLADGRVIECDDHHDQDLFWALRGAGGGSFGVVTSLSFRTVPAPPATCFHLVWRGAHAAKVIDAWQAWAPAAPREIAASLLMTASALGHRPIVNLFGAMLGTCSAAGELLGDLVALAGVDPVSAYTKHMPYEQTKRYLAALGDQMRAASPGQRAGHGREFSKSEFFAQPLSGIAIEALLANLDEQRIQGQFRELDFTPWAGAYNLPPAHATAFAHRDGLFLLKHTAVVNAGAPAAQRDRARRWSARSWAAVHEWGSGGVYPNFPDPDLTNWARAYHGSNRSKLKHVKAKYDPDGFFRFRRAHPPAPCHHRHPGQSPGMTSP
jgi:FAD/FMN-containing dehydrogenase